jgi:hypothetical protein
MATKTEGKVFGTMNARSISRLVGVALAGLVAVGASNCADQREPECTVAPFASYGVKLTEIGPPTGTNCNIDEKDDLFSVGFKNPSALDLGLRPFVVLGSDKYPDYEIPQRVALQFSAMGNLQARAEDSVEGFVPNAPNPVYAYGHFANPRPSNDLCEVVEIANAQLAVPAIPIAQPDPEDFPVDDPETEDDDESRDFSSFVQATGDTEVTAAWSNMRVLVSTAYPGTQFEATLTYNYSVTAHETFDVDANGNPIFLDDGSAPLVDAAGMPARVGGPDSALVALADLTLKPKTAEAYQCSRTYLATGVFAQAIVCGEDADCAPENSGVNPDFPVTCDTAAGLCVLNGPFLTGKRQ